MDRRSLLKRIGAVVAGVCGAKVLTGAAEKAPVAPVGGYSKSGAIFVDAGFDPELDSFDGLGQVDAWPTVKPPMPPHRRRAICPRCGGTMARWYERAGALYGAKRLVYCKCRECHYRLDYSKSPRWISRGRPLILRSCDHCGVPVEISNVCVVGRSDVIVKRLGEGVVKICGVVPGDVVEIGDGTLLNVMVVREQDLIASADWLYRQ